jgi:hypothetical protein
MKHYMSGTISLCIWKKEWGWEKDIHTNTEKVRGGERKREREGEKERERGRERERQTEREREREREREGIDSYDYVGA